MYNESNEDETTLHTEGSGEVLSSEPTHDSEMVQGGTTEVEEDWPSVADYLAGEDR